MRRGQQELTGRDQQCNVDVCIGGCEIADDVAKY